MHGDVDLTSAGMSGVEGSSHLTVIRVEDGRIRHYMTHRDWSAALEAAGAVDSSPGDGRDATGRAARGG